ncbi:MAG: hypothetical protein R2694_00965 [Ilumatobacteraceae bacterium]
MERLGRRGERFDLVVVDPPSFAQRQQQVPRALAAYARLTELAVRLVRPGAPCCNARAAAGWSADQFHAGVAAPPPAGRPLTELRRTAHAVDHPVTFPEGAYLKAVLADVP